LGEEIAPDCICIMYANILSGCKLLVNAVNVNRNKETKGK